MLCLPAAPPPTLSIVHTHAHGIVVLWDVPEIVEAQLIRFKLEVFSVDPAGSRNSLVLRINSVDPRTRAFNLAPLTAGVSYMAILSAETAGVEGFPEVLQFTV